MNSVVLVISVSEVPNPGVPLHVSEILEQNVLDIMICWLVGVRINPWVLSVSSHVLSLSSLGAPTPQGGDKGTSQPFQTSGLDPQGYSG